MKTIKPCYISWSEEVFPFGDIGWGKSSTRVSGFSHCSTFIFLPFNSTFDVERSAFDVRLFAL